MQQSLTALIAASSLAITAVAFGQTKDSQPAGQSAMIVGPGYYVSDIDKSLEFYRDILGMTVRMKFGNNEQSDVVIGYGMQMTSASIMLLSDHKAGKPKKIEHSHGYSRLAMNVPDLADLKIRLTEAGYETSDIKLVHGAFLMMMATDPDGYKLELLQAIAPE